jgi:hypothetical protein
MKTKTNDKTIGSALLCCFLTTATVHGQLAVSTFDSDADGWTVIDRHTITHLYVGTRTPVYHSTGGNPGGYIQSQDALADWYWRAPAKFLGNKSAAFGGTLTFDIIADYDISFTNVIYTLMMEGGGTTLRGDFVVYALEDAWLHWSIPLSVHTNWLDFATGLPATTNQMLTVLSNLAVLDINGEYGDGRDVGSIDNITMLPCSPRSMIRVSEVEVCWDSQTSVLYDVQFRPDLELSTWAPLYTNVVGTGSMMCVGDRVALGQPRRFYRVLCSTNGVGE